MAVRRADRISVYQLRLLAYTYRVLVAIECLLAFLCPACFYVLVALLVGIVVPQFIALALLYLPKFRKCGVNNMGNRLLITFRSNRRPCRKLFVSFAVNSKTNK